MVYLLRNRDSIWALVSRAGGFYMCYLASLLTFVKSASNLLYVISSVCAGGSLANREATRR